MSFRKPLVLKLSPRARQDFVDILRYTGETWGQGQLLVYRNEINELYVIDDVQNPSYPPFYPQGVRRWVPRCYAATLPLAKGGTFSDHGQAYSPLCKGGLGGICSF